MQVSMQCTLSLRFRPHTWTVGGTLGISLFSGGRVSGQIEVAQANLEEARARLAQSRELAALDTRVATKASPSTERASMADTRTCPAASPNSLPIGFAAETTRCFPSD